MSNISNFSRTVRDNSSYKWGHCGDWHKRASPSNHIRAYVQVVDVLLHFVFDSTECGVVGQRLFVWKTMKNRILRPYNAVPT